MVKSKKRSDRHRRGRTSGTALAEIFKKANIKISRSTIMFYVLVFVNSILIISFGHKLFQKAIDINIVEEKPIIEVQNGCGVHRIATKITDNLRYLEYEVARKGNADHFNYEHTIMVDLGSNKEIGIEKLRKDIGIEKDDVYLMREESDVDVRIIIGKDYQSLKIFSLP